MGTKISDCSENQTANTEMWSDRSRTAKRKSRKNHMTKEDMFLQRWSFTSGEKRTGHRDDGTRRKRWNPQSRHCRDAYRLLGEEDVQQFKVVCRSLSKPETEISSIILATESANATDQHSCINNKNKLKCMNEKDRRERERACCMSMTHQPRGYICMTFARNKHWVILFIIAY